MMETYVSETLDLDSVPKQVPAHEDFVTSTRRENFKLCCFLTANGKVIFCGLEGKVLIPGRDFVFFFFFW
jgi:hypothetical protein